MTVTIWQDANIVTMEHPDAFEIIHNGALIVENGKIRWVGEQSQIPASYQSAIRQSTKGALVTPGLIDCHTHLVYAGNRVQDFSQRLQGLSYEEIAQQGGGIYSTVMATQHASFDELYHAAKKRVIAMIQEGVTTLEIKSGYGLDLTTEHKICQVARQLGQELPVDIQVTYLGPHMLPKDFSSSATYLKFVCNEVLPHLVQEQLIDAVDAFCETIAFKASELELFLQLAQQSGLKIKLHAEQLSACGGAKLAAKYHAVCADHLEHIDEDGIKALKASGTVGVLLPGANYFLKQDTKPPIAQFRHYQLPMAVATDANPGTCPTTSLLLMLNMACIEFGLTPFEALQGVTVHAAKAMGMLSHKGTLTPHKDADFVLWDLQQPEELAYRLGSNPCLRVIKKGKPVYERSQAF